MINQYILAEIIIEPPLLQSPFYSWGPFIIDWIVSFMQSTSITLKACLAKAYDVTTQR